MLKTIVSLFVVIFAVTSFAAQGKKVAIDTKNSEINWKGWKVVKLADNHVGTVGINEGHLMIEKDKITGGTIVVDMTTIKNTDLTDKKYNTKLVNHLNGKDFFDVKNHKKALYEIKSVKDLKAGKHEFTGTLTIRGKKQENVKLTANVSKKGKMMTAKGKMTFDRTKFDVKYNSKSYFPNLWKTAKEKVISNDIELNFNIKTKAM